MTPQPVAAAAPVAIAVKAAIEAIGQDVAEVDRKAASREGFATPYYVLDPGSIVDLRGSAQSPRESGTHVVRVTTVGATSDGVNAFRDKARSALLDPDLPIDGHAVVWSDQVGSTPNTPDNDLTPPVIYGVDIYHLHVTPT